jgi:hypothetical protein
MSSRRFPPPWSIVDNPESFAITDATGQVLAYIYFEDEPGWRRTMNRLTQIQEAVARRAAGEALVEIGRSYNVSHSTILRL